MSGADQVPAVVSGSADVTGTAISAALYNGLARGLPLKMVADHGANLKGASAGGWVVRKDLVDSGAYKGPADMKGKKVAVGTPTSTADISLDRFLRGGGLTIKDIDLVVLAFTEMFPAFVSKALDGAYYQEPFTTVAVDQGAIVRGPIGYEIYPNQQIAALTFGQKLSGDRSLSLRYLRAYVRGVRDYVKAFIDKDQQMFDAVAPIIINRTTLKDRALLQRAIPSGLGASAILNVQSIKDDQDWMVEMGAVKQKADIDRYVDLSLVQDVNSQLGPAS